MKRPLLLGFVTAAVLVAGLGGWWLFRFQKREQEVQRTLAEAEKVLGEKRPDRDQLARTMQALRVVADRDRRLARACARAEILAGESQRALERMDAVAALGAVLPEDSRVIAQACERIYCLSGDQDLGRRALASSEVAAEVTGAAEDHYRAWRMARRLGNDTGAAAHARVLLDGGDDTAWKRRVGASNLVDDGRYGEALDALSGLEEEFGDEPEFHLETAQCLLRRPEPDPADLDRARKALEEALRGYPFLVQARSAAGVVYHALGRKELRDTHLDWCLTNAPDHPSWAEWKALRDSPLGSR